MNEKVVMMMGSSARLVKWSSESHHSFPLTFKILVDNFLKSLKIFEMKTNLKIPKPLKMIIISLLSEYHCV